MSNYNEQLHYLKTWHCPSCNASQQNSKENKQ